MLDIRRLTQTAADWDRNPFVSKRMHHEAAYALLRVAFGMVFLVAGFGKLMGGVGNIAGQQAQQFAGILPEFFVIAFFYVLPFIELITGVLIVSGLFNIQALIISGLLLIALIFGTLIKGDFPTAAHNVFYALVNSALLWFADYNRYSLGQLLRRGRF